MGPLHASWLSVALSGCAAAEVYADPEHASFEALQFVSGVGTILNAKVGPGTPPLEEIPLLRSCGASLGGMPLVPAIPAQPLSMDSTSSELCNPGCVEGAGAREPSSSPLATRHPSFPSSPFLSFPLLPLVDSCGHPRGQPGNEMGRFFFLVLCGPCAWRRRG